MVTRKQEVEQILADHFFWDKVLQITVHNDGTVDVSGDGSLVFKDDIGVTWNQLPFKFGKFSSNLMMAGAGLRTLEGFPEEIIDGRLVVSRNNLKNFKGGPKRVDDGVSARNMPYLTSLEGFPTQINGWVRLDYDPNLPLLRTLVAKKGIVLFPSGPRTERIENIMDKYAGQGRAAVIDCKRDLVAAGFEGNARW